MLDGGVDRVPVSRPSSWAKFCEAVFRLVLPVLMLVGFFLGLWWLRATPASDLHFLVDYFPTIEPAFTMPGWLNWGYLLVPGVFVLLNLIGRRYGPSISLWAVLLSWIALAGLIYWALAEAMIDDFQTDIAPYGIAATFVGALFLSQLVAIAIFDNFRGIPWWKAPFLASLIGGLVFSVAFNARAALQWNDVLAERLMVEAGLAFCWAVLQLIPTQLLRGAIRPLPGFGGA
ncbi:MAG: hypothetical protein GC184_07930 [Rhizobiales bacterium]|nr:hypothetical protein [Hyphomicrobiales bacterium]